MKSHGSFLSKVWATQSKIEVFVKKRIIEDDVVLVAICILITFCVFYNHSLMVGW